MTTTDKPYVYDARVTLKLVSQVCCKCGVVFGMESGYDAERRRDSATFHCPNGHAQHYAGRTEEQKLRDQLERAKVRERHLEDQRDAAERSARAYKGQVTRVRRRVANGVCPCCTRSFSNLADHMATKHPDYASGGDR